MSTMLCPAGVGSQSMVGSLCREAAWLRVRGAQLLHDLAVCQSPALWQRLHRERCWLQERRAELQRIAPLIEGGCRGGQGIGAALLRELSARPVADG